MPLVFASPLAMTAEQRSQLETMARSTSLPHRKVVQAKALLLAADGVGTNEVARRCGTTDDSVRAWRRRFAEKGLDGVGRIAPGRGRRSWAPEGTVQAVVHDTLYAVPDDDSTHWTTRSMAARHGIGKDTVARIWRDHQLRPWKVDRFKISNDVNFERKLVDLVGLYLNPPERAVVFSFDEKTQCQALDRTQPSLPLRPGRAGTMTHDYKRNGTTDLFAALNVATGQVLTDCRSTHTAADVLRFFKLIDLNVAKHLDIHVVLDNLATHKAPEVQAWLAHPKRAGGTCTSSPPAPAGSIWSSAGSKSSPTAGCAAVPSPAWPISSTPSRPGSSTGTTTRSPSCGTRRPTRSSPRCAAAGRHSPESNPRRMTRASRTSSS